MDCALSFPTAPLRPALWRRRDSAAWPAAATMDWPRAGREGPESWC